MSQSSPSSNNKKKSILSNILFVAVFILVLFTPVGGVLKLWTSKLLASFAPSVQRVDEREQLTQYNWLLTDSRGESFNLSEARGKVILVNMWATWCPPCVAEMSSLQELYNQYANNPNVVFLFATTDEKSAVDKFMNSNEYRFPVFYMHSAPPALLASNSIPITFLIGKNGHIAIRKVGAANWHSKRVTETIDALLQE